MITKIVQFISSFFLFIGIGVVCKDQQIQGFTTLLIFSAVFAVFNLFPLITEDGKALIRKIKVGEEFKVLSLFEQDKKTYIFYRLKSGVRTYLTEVPSTRISKVFEVGAAYVYTDEYRYVKIDAS